MRCTFEYPHDGWIHMLPNWHFGLLGDPENLHFNVYLFLPHNCFYKKTVKHLSLYTLERHNCGGREELQWSWKRVYMPRNKGSSQNVIQQQVGSLDTYTFAWVSAVSNHISPKFYDVNHINYVLQCAKTFYAFSFCQWTLI